MQVAYYSNYFVWFEVARCELLRSVGRTYRDLEAAGFMLPVIEAHCEYRQPARYDDELTILTRGKLMSPVRVQFAYEVRRTGDGAMTALGHTVHASVDGEGKPARLPIDVQELLTQA